MAPHVEQRLSSLTQALGLCRAVRSYQTSIVLVPAPWVAHHSAGERVGNAAVHAGANQCPGETPLPVSSSKQKLQSRTANRQMTAPRKDEALAFWCSSEMFFI